jgi:hypothetical protein
MISVNINNLLFFSNFNLFFFFLNFLFQNFHNINNATQKRVVEFTFQVEEASFQVVEGEPCPFQVEEASFLGASCPGGAYQAYQACQAREAYRVGAFHPSFPVASFPVASFRAFLGDGACPFHLEGAGSYRVEEPCVQPLEKRVA